MSNLTINENSFESEVQEQVAIARLKGQVVKDLATSPQSADLFVDFLRSVNDAPEVLGLVQINDSDWDCRSDADAFVELLTKEKERMPYSRWGSYQYEVFAARFRNSVGRILLEMIQFQKPAVAGMQGEISSDYLGSTLAFDMRIAKADSTFVFENMRIGLPASAGVTFLMPRYIGVGRTMELVQRGAKIGASEALALGLVSKVIDENEDLSERCRNEIVELHGNSHRHVFRHHRQHIFPSVSEVEIALERYYKAMVASLNELRMSRERAS